MDNEALLGQHHENLPVPNKSKDHGISLLTGTGFLFLTFNSGMAVCRSNGDFGAIAFVAFSYLDLVLLFTACGGTRGQPQSRLAVNTSRWRCGCSPQCLPLPSHTRWRQSCRSRCRCSYGPWPARQCWVASTPSSCTGRKLRHNKV